MLPLSTARSTMYGKKKPAAKKGKKGLPPAFAKNAAKKKAAGKKAPGKGAKKLPAFLKKKKSSKK